MRCAHLARNHRAFGSFRNSAHFARKQRAFTIKNGKNANLEDFWSVNGLEDVQFQLIMKSKNQPLPTSITDLDFFAVRRNFAAFGTRSLFENSGEGHFTHFCGKSREKNLEFWAIFRANSAQLTFSPRNSARNSPKKTAHCAARMAEIFRAFLTSLLRNLLRCRQKLRSRAQSN